MKLSENDIKRIVKEVINKTYRNDSTSRYISPTQSGVFPDISQAVSAAHEAFMEFKDRSKECRKRITDAVRQMTLNNLKEFAEMTVNETGMGRIDHKIEKFKNAAINSPGVEFLEPEAWTGKNGLALDEYSPYGVVGNITPSTHPGPTMINNIIIQLSAGNTITFNPHPSAKNLNAKIIRLANKYMVEEGAPNNCVTCIDNPTLDSAKQLFGDKRVELLSITGGPAMVDLAMGYSKKIIAAGPGNPPVLIDETADLSLAAEEITMSSSFDNNILCIAEKEIFVVESVFENFMDEMIKKGNYRLTIDQMNNLANSVLEKKGKHWLIKKEYAGKNANILAAVLGITLNDDVPLLFGETLNDNPWVVAEQMTSCIPVVKVIDFGAGVTACLKAEHGFKHTASIYTNNMERATEFTRALNCDVHTINGGTLRGNGGDLGEAYFSHTIATPTGEGICTPKHFTRKRRIMIHKSFRFS